MFENIDKLIDINLKLLSEQINTSLFKVEFRNENNRKPRNLDRLAEYMENKGLIVIEPNKKYRCDLTKFGYDIAKNGGWLKYLNETEIAKKRKEEIEFKKAKIIETREKAELENLKWSTQVSKFQVKYKLLPYIVSILSLIFSMYTYFSNKNSSENHMSKTKILKIVDSIYLQKNTIAEKKEVDTLQVLNKIDELSSKFNKSKQ